MLAGGLFTDGLKAAGFKGDVQYAGGSGVSDQQSQIQSMITNGAKVIIIGAVDGGQLTAQAKAAHDAGATVIAYDRLILNSKDVDYYVAYDNEKASTRARPSTTSSCSPARPTTPTRRSSSTAP